jgi:peptidoglycan-associated lipoprotein
MAQLSIGAASLALVLVAAAGCGSAKVDVNANLNAGARPAPPPPVPVASAPPPAAQVASGDAVLEGDRIRLAKAIYYDVDKDSFRPESYPVMDAVAKILQSHPEISGLVVEGHTDNQGSYEHNLKLSERRAQAVVRYLATQQIKIPMQAPGYGATAPICHDSGDTCRQTNRRVEFKVKRK